MLRNEYYKDDMMYVTYLTRQVLRLLGVWPPYNRRRSFRERVQNYLLILFMFFLLLCVLIPGSLYWMIEKRIRVRVRTLPLLFFGIVTCSKYGSLIFHERNIRRCLKHMEEDWRTVSSAETRNTMIESANIGRRLVTLCAIFMYGSGMFFRSILPFAKGKIITAENVTIRPLPCPAYFIFFNIQDSPAYELVFTMQFVSGMITFSITTALCGLAAVFVMHACGQLKILMALMRNLVEDQRQEKQDFDKRLAIIVEHQTRIRSFVRMVGDTLQQACLIELGACTMIVCLLGYFIIMEWENSNAIAMCSYFMTVLSMLINMFLFCYTGEQLSVQADKVASTSCDLDWYRLPHKKARGIILVIIISNLPTKITAGKLMDLSFKTYGNVVKTSFTYFNMLVNMID